MELRYLATFLAVADTGNMTMAAMRCNMTQGAVSHHIKLLEDELHADLFVRKARDLTLTDVGKALLKRARVIVREEQESRDEIMGMRGQLCGELRLGVGSFIEPYIRRAAIRFMKKHPRVLLHVQFDHASVLNKMLRNEDIDLAFTMNTAYHNEGIVSRPCIPFRLSAIMSRRHRLAGKDAVSWDDLMGCKIIMPDVGERVFNTFQHYTEHDISKLPVAAIVGSAHAALMVLEEMDFVTFLPSEYVDNMPELAAKRIDFLDLELMSNVHRLRSVPMKASAREFLREIGEMMAEDRAEIGG